MMFHQTLYILHRRQMSANLLISRWLIYSQYHLRNTLKTDNVLLCCYSETKDTNFWIYNRGVAWVKGALDKMWKKCPVSALSEESKIIKKIWSNFIWKSCPCSKIFVKFIRKIILKIFMQIYGSKILKFCLFFKFWALEPRRRSATGPKVHCIGQV